MSAVAVVVVGEIVVPGAGVFFKGNESVLNGSSHLPPRVSTSPRGRNWHLTATAESRGCRGFTGPVPQPLWIKESVFGCPADYTKAFWQRANPCIHIGRYWGTRS